MRKNMKILMEYAGHAIPPSLVDSVQSMFHKIGETFAGAIERGDIDDELEFRDSNVAAEEGGRWVMSMVLKFVPDDSQTYRGKHHKEQKPSQFHEDDGKNID